LVVVIGFFALLLFTPIGKAAGIAMNQKRYFSWIEDNRPYLKELVGKRGLDRRVELFSDGWHVYPYVVYEVVYGDTDGIASFSYKLKIANNFGPLDFMDEDISVILLPAREQRMDEGRIRNVYWGRYVESSEATKLVSRIISGDRLLDIKDSVESRPNYPLSCWADTDDWVALTANKESKTAVEAIPAEPGIRK
jgi:hypothetical protein